ncbi:MAG TPA: hypothetical protein VJ717_02055 [Gemmatimonadaceae bacterium]|nr:hypothetical protein [Gemmatimonadaceae bacterium]
MYVLNADRQHRALRGLRPLDGSPDDWHMAFVDPESGQRWVRFFHRSEARGGGWPVLRHDPPPAELPEWLAACFRSGDSEDVLGLAWEMSHDPERWPQIVEWLETQRQFIDAETLRLFIKHLEILPTLGKHTSANDRHFIELGSRARKLMNGE